MLEPGQSCVGTRTVMCWNQDSHVLEPGRSCVGTRAVMCWNQGSHVLEPGIHMLGIGSNTWTAMPLVLSAMTSIILFI